MTSQVGEDIKRHAGRTDSTDSQTDKIDAMLPCFQAASGGTHTGEPDSQLN